MAYAPPTITPAGLIIPSYQDILNYLIQHTISIYGTGDYLDPDSADYQALSIIALLESDAMQAAQIDYWNRGPVTAIGAGLDGIVKLNGMVRKAATYSTCQLTVTGTVGTVITNGVAQDLNGIQWNLPASVTIPGAGSITVNATCAQLGAVNAPPGTIVIRVTSTAGWTGVTNSVAAVPGVPVESDMQLRARQAISVALPSQTRLQGTIAAIAAVPGVTRYLVQENPTNVIDQWGNPPHSITATVEGGLDQQVAQVIYNNKSIGCYTNGTTVVSVVDPITGVTTPIRFNRPLYVPFSIDCQIHLFSGDPTYWVNAAQTAIVNYMNSLQIGEILTISALTAVVMNLNQNIDNPTISARSIKISYSSGVSAITLAAGGAGYNQWDTLTVIQQNSANTVEFYVGTVGTGGVVTAVSGIAQQGVGYVTANGLATTGGAGSGCTVNITAGAIANSGTDFGVGPTQVVQGITTNVTVYTA